MANEFDSTAKYQPVRKVRVTLTGDRDLGVTTFTVEAFRREPDGNWLRRLNMGEFRLRDREGDVISPGFLDVDELCGAIVEGVLVAMYK
jgi:hypothetical protein